MKRMKYLCLALICLILPLAAAAAELPAEVSMMLEMHYPGYAVAAQAGGGNETQGQIALVLSKGGHNVLCIAEKAVTDTAYAFTVQTDAAVRQGDDVPDLLIDSAGDVLFYTYQDEHFIFRDHAEKTRDGWGDVDIISISMDEYAIENILSMRDLFLRISKAGYDENGNPLYQDTLLVIAADAQGNRRLFIMELQPDGSYKITQSTPLDEGVLRDLFHA